MKFQYYDANCLVKLVVEETWSKELREHFYPLGATAITTSFCFYEALGVLKTKWARNNRPDSITQENYLAASEELCALVEDSNIQLEELSFYDRATCKTMSSQTAEIVNESYFTIFSRNGYHVTHEHP